MKKFKVAIVGESLCIDCSDELSDPGTDCVTLSLAQVSELSVRLPDLVAKMHGIRRHRLIHERQELEQQIAVTDAALAACNKE